MDRPVPVDVIAAPFTIVMPVHTPSFRTSRLLLRPLTLADAAPAQPLFAEWEIVRLLNARVPWPFPPDGCLAYYRDEALPAMARGEEWHWAICLPETESQPETFIGLIALFLSKSETPTNRGFWIGLPFQRRGYASEACVPVTRFWFETLHQPSLTIPKAAGNLASRRISEKSGMTLLRTEPHAFVSGIHPADIWHQTREEYARHGLRANP
jgi:RimJ/RimL family protein N-acetyltransferase